ncbi:MAG: translation elongation factor G [Desulfobacteraceae bacterium 4484_190.1]|nr:elongation factor G [Deltaproteobacteria bacterium]OPX40393.1 MAG: translation elongation factor G [Desulfobacteraceae bacterium 4484_190.1]
MINDIQRLRNIGISAHIDSGKTTLTERILFYTNRIFAIHEVRGKDGVGAKMDSMELEKERGITIASAATYCEWKGHRINIIDTPGHVDFTIEVERALRIMDGAILILCAVGGVQSQSITVDRQMNRYKVPRIAFINKCDRAGANPYKVVDQLRQRLNHNAVLTQMPIGLEGRFSGLVDLVSMKAVYFEGINGEHIKSAEIPEEILEEAQARREELLDAVSMFSDDLMEAVFEERVSEDLIRQAIRKGTLLRELTPVFVGAAYKNIGVQLLLDGITGYLPAPTDVENEALDLENNEKRITLKNDPDMPAVGLAFKLEVTPYGQLTYLRVYQGSISKGDDLYITRTMKKIKVGRLVRIHADEMEEVQKVYAGDIIGLFGVDCFSGDTFTDGSLRYSMSSMFVPEPVISLSVIPEDNRAQENLTKALNRFVKEDPTFKSYVDKESNETIISGMGELHLDVYVERMKREFNAKVTTGIPRVAYREAITRHASFNYIHKKQTGGAGQYARVEGFIEPSDDGVYEFINRVKGGSIPTEFISSVDKGFQSCLKKGLMTGFPVLGMKVTVNDGHSHSVDSSERAFLYAAIGAFKYAYLKAKPIILEPIMKIAIECPSEYQGNVMSSLNQRRGLITSSAEDGVFTVIDAEAPLSEMFGYATILRSLTQGKGDFTMEFLRYLKVPGTLSEELKKTLRDSKKGGNK